MNFTAVGSILITGGAGYIGTHCAVSLVQAGFKVVIVDDFSNSNDRVITAVSRIVGSDIASERCDLLQYEKLKSIFSKHQIAAVIHLAGHKSVSESLNFPVKYYENNVIGFVNLLKAMETFECRTLILSSTAAIYSPDSISPITETAQLRPTSPYGWSKLFLERIAEDIFSSSSDSKIAALRYFNPVGAHESGLIGENPLQQPSNLMPLVAEVARGVRERVKIYGADYPTIDGTGVRDFIHVSDLADGHVAALKHLLTSTLPCFLKLNIGTGRGQSVLQMIKAFEQASGKVIPYGIYGRRPGDVGECWADNDLATRTLGWSPTRTLAQMCDDLWMWIRKTQLV
jgi:UDP-glucose 4-epimerase